MLYAEDVVAGMFIMLNDGSYGTINDVSADYDGLINIVVEGIRYSFYYGEPVGTII